MGPWAGLTSEELLQFFHVKKTEMSCMKKPLTFLCQLRDHNLIPEDTYKKVSRMKREDTTQRGVYELLDWLERKRSQHIHLFWRCVFEDAVLNQYPTLRELRNSLMDGSFREDIRLLERVGSDNENKRKKLPDEETVLDSVKKKKRRNARVLSDDDDDDEQQQQLGPSSLLPPGQKKNSKKEEKRQLRSERVFGDEQPGPSSSSPPIKGDLTVTCGDLQGALSKSKLAKGEECICFNKRWLTPSEFERRAGKQSSKNWKLSICCDGVSLAKLIQNGRLKSGSFKRGAKAKKSSSPPDQDFTDRFSSDEDIEDGNESEEYEDEEDQTSSSNEEGSTVDTDEEATEQQQEDDHDNNRMMFTVTCGAATATLHKRRFASGSRGKSVRTETSWMTPEEFVSKVSCQADACWRKDIMCEGQTLGLLVMEKILKIHSPLCDCSLCSPDDEDLAAQRNDDECYVCRSDEGADLVVCDCCPRSFHQTCHLPHIEDAALSNDGPWRCTFCELRSHSNSAELDLQAATSQPVSGHLLKCQYLLLCLCRQSKQRLRTPAGAEVQISSAGPQTPKWFDEIAEKLQGTESQTVRKFMSDVRLILSQDDAEPVHLRELFEEEFKKVFKIRD